MYQWRKIKKVIKNEIYLLSKIKSTKWTPAWFTIKTSLVIKRITIENDKKYNLNKWFNPPITSSTNPRKVIKKITI